MFHVRGTRKEPIADTGSIVLLSLPEFLWGLFFILLFGVALELLPFTGRLSSDFQRPVVTGFLLLDTLLVGRPDMFWNALKHMILPSLALGIAFSPTIMRVLRSSLIDVYQEDYIHQARLRGLSERRILIRHGLKNAILPTLSLMGVQFGFLFGGTLLIEVIYSYPGLGNLMVDAVRNADLPIIQAVGLTYCVVVLVINTVVDVALRHPQSEAEDRVSAERCRAWLRSGRVLTGLTIVVAIALIALFAPLLAPHDPNEQNLLSTFLPPAWASERRGGVPARHRLARPLRALAPDLRRARRHDGRDRRLVRRHADRRGAGARRGLFRRLDRLADRPHRRRLDVVPAGDPVADPDGRARHRPAQRDPGDRAGRLDALLPRAARRGAGGDAARLRGGGAPRRLLPLAHDHARDPARHHAAADHAASASKWASR